ncbi:MAG: HK97 gp10 family phage protein [Baekduia sp.]
MAYVGGSLTSLFGQKPQAATKLAARDMAAKGADRMHEVAAQNTPVKTGRLRTGWYQLPVTKTHYLIAPAFRSGIANDYKYAPFVEYGTGLFGPRHRAYVITPKKAPFLAWRDPVTGQWIRARKVLHPGSPGNHMVAIAAAVVEAETDAGPLMQVILDRWAREVEASAD